MATVIDAFITTLGLDGTQFRKGMEDATKSHKKLDATLRRDSADRERQERLAALAQKKRQKEHDDRVKATVDGYKKIRTGLLGIAAVFTAGVGIKDFITDTVNGAAGLGYLSANLRLSTQELTSWQRASERAGGSADGIISQLRESADTLAQLKSGMGPNEGLQSFFRWGGNADDLKDGNTYLLARSRIIAGMFKADPAQAALIAKSMGISDDQFNFLKQGPDAVMALVRAQEKHAAITAKDAQAALELRNKTLELRDTLQSTTVRVLTALLPSLMKLADWLVKIADRVEGNKEAIAGWIENTDWSGMVDGAKEFAAAVASIAKNLGDIIDRWDEWMGKPKIQTPGVTKMAGALRFGKKGDLDADNLATGKPVVSASGPKNPTLARISGIIEEGVARTLASFGVTSAKEWVRDTTGKDDYNAGPKVAKSVMQKLMAQGWTAEQAAGITGSLQQESGLNPAARNPKSGAYGIAQWLSKDRVANFKKFTGRDLVGSTLDEQLAFQHHELTKGSEQAAGRRLRAAKTAEEAARIHSTEYERPGDLEANVARRQRLAAQHAAAGRAENALVVGGLPAGAGASAPAARGSVSTSTSQTTVENINVYTQATDAAGIAKEMRPAVEKYTFATQANTGQR